MTDGLKHPVLADFASEKAIKTTKTKYPPSITLRIIFGKMKTEK